jgi:hypothetical protein
VVSRRSSHPSRLTDSGVRHPRARQKEVRKPTIFTQAAHSNGINSFYAHWERETRQVPAIHVGGVASDNRRLSAHGLRAHAVPEEYVQHVIDIAIETNQGLGPAAEDQSRLIAALREPVRA